MKKIMIAVIVFLLVGFAMTAPVFSQERGLSVKEKKELDGYETSYKNEVRKVLDAHALELSGINMTKVIYEDGMVEYTLCIHNDKLNRMTRKQRETLKEEMSQIPFGRQDVLISYDFI